MAFFVVGLVLLILKLLAYGPVAQLSWWLILLPFLLALVWWEAIEPLLGLDKKRDHKTLEKIKAERIKKQLRK